MQRRFRKDFLIVESLELWADVAVREGQAVWAAGLLAAAEALCVDMRLHPARRVYERTVARVRVQLDEANFAAAWEAGQALTLEQAVAEALAEIRSGEAGSRQTERCS